MPVDRREFAMLRLRRREFLGLGLGVAGLSYVSLAGATRGHGLFERAAEASERAERNDHALVVIELDGGNDGLNTLIPFEDALYYRNRRTLGIPRKEVIRLDDRVGFHPRMKALGELFRAGQVAVVQGVGYPQPDRSHFRSMEIWHTATTDPAPATGWLGRYLEAPSGPEPGPGPDAFPRGLALTDSLPQALQAQRATVPVVAQLDSLGEADETQAALLRKLSTAPGAKGPAAFLRRQADTLYRTADRLKAAVEKAPPSSAIAYPEGDLGGQLHRAAQILGADLGVRVLFVSQDGFDTHAGQADQHGNLLEGLSQSLDAFRRDLAARKLSDRVLVLVFSEFGRRVDENASGGTDHGAASCLFLVGSSSQVKGGLAGRHPSLETLGDGDLIYNTDFRSVYATILDRWLGCPAEQVLGKPYPILDLIAGS
jgi:uncharacterized protein (DUF1501 family)